MPLSSISYKTALGRILSKIDSEELSQVDLTKIKNQFNNEVKKFVGEKIETDEKFRTEYFTETEITFTANLHDIVKDDFNDWQGLRETNYGIIGRVAWDAIDNMPQYIVYGDTLAYALHGRTVKLFKGYKLTTDKFYMKYVRNVIDIDEDTDAIDLPLYTIPDMIERVASIMKAELTKPPEKEDIN